MLKKEFSAETLVRAAVDALKKSYAPYSGFNVGAAIICSDGEIITGCNIENASYPVTVCAERVALYKAVSEGRKKFMAASVVGGINGIITDFCAPCGMCRQAFTEFCSPDFLFYLYDGSKFKSFTLGELMPESFNGGLLK
ncbi:MAG: cytidine deaminase [Oscillospiraceae bacterium]|nr:cytidine deaminase [Oscillospiraceae bacterium]